MKKVRINALVDALGLISFIPMIISGLMLFLYWPTGSGGYQGGRNSLFATEVLGLTHYEWVQVHDISCLLFTILIVIHLILHWRFMRHIGRYLTNNELVKKES